MPEWALPPPAPDRLARARHPLATTGSGLTHARSGGGRGSARASEFADHDGDVGVQVDAADGRADRPGVVHAARFGHAVDEGGISQLAESFVLRGL
jgi:hypothetical protein